MFHHFHDERIHSKSQGSISKDEFYQIIKFIGKKNILNADDFYYPNALEIVKKYFEQHHKIDFLFGSVQKYKIQHGYYPKKIYRTFGFYSSHSVGFFIKTDSQKKAGYYNTKYKYSSDYDLFYRMIVKMKMKGIATKKNDILGYFSPGGLSSRIKYIDYLNVMRLYLQFQND